ncbi:SPOR domain-containing protein [Qipengyuania sp.]|uniref:SPOR domain-containing protein n=1 Tax=Qipengyuania sp. TaxID=2004515 RepID=UPI003BAADD89
MRLPNRIVFAALAGLGAIGLGACASTAQTAPAPATRSIENGPAADYPIVLGDPFTIDGVTYTPVDTLNYDQVGYVTGDEPGAMGVTGAHRTLPLPSYVEVTALDTGRTILVRLERRGPMTNDRLLALSSAALTQLRVGEGAPIRMRRVNPPEEHRADLRAGREAPLRMDTPTGLLEVLKRRLPARGSAPLGDPRQTQVSGVVPTPGTIATLDPDEEAAVTAAAPDDVNEQPAAPAPEVLRPQLPMAVDGGPARAPVMVPTDPDGRFAIQLGAFAIRGNADRLAREVQGYVETSGSLALVRVGPFATRGQAEQALAKLRERGYSDALIRLID